METFWRSLVKNKIKNIDCSKCNKFEHLQKRFRFKITPYII